MLGAASLLTLVTLGGLIAGFGREWLLVASWGAGARTDAFVIAMFVPEAVRAILAAGLLTSAALPLWQARPTDQQRHWFSQLSLVFALCSVVLAACVSLASPWLVHLMGPGLPLAQRHETEASLTILAWSLPGMVLQAWWAVPRQAAGHFLLAGMGSLLYNLPAMLYLLAYRSQAHETALCWAFVSGSALMGLIMLPSALRGGLRLVPLHGSQIALRELALKLGPLLGSALAGQGLTLLERIVASYLGEGVVTAVNLARKLINLPLIALQSLNQVLLSLMSRSEAERVALLRKGLSAVTIVSLPAAVGLMLGSPALVAMLFPKVQGTTVVVPLLAGYAAILVLAGWNTLLARYHYAEGDTRGPVVSELRGSLLQAVALAPLAWLAGSLGIVWALLLGTLLTGQLLLRVPALRQGLGLIPQAMVSAAWLLVTWFVLRPHLADAPVWQLGEAVLLGAVCLVFMAAWLRPWRHGG